MSEFATSALGLILLLVTVHLVACVTFKAYFEARFKFINRILNMQKETKNGEG